MFYNDLIHLCTIFSLDIMKIPSNDITVNGLCIYFYDDLQLSRDTRIILAHKQLTITVNVTFFAK